MRDEGRNKIRLTRRSKLVVGFGELVPMEPGYDSSEEQDTSTVTKENGGPTKK